MADNPLNQALNNLDSTIETINDKVQNGIGKAREYRQNILERLRQLADQIDNLKKNDVLNSIPKLKGDLIKANTELSNRTKELETSKQQLTEANKIITDLNAKLQNINKQLADKTAELEKAQNIIGAKDNQIASQDSHIQELTKNIEELNEQKKQAEDNLAGAQKEMSDLVDRIAKINFALVKKIKMIDQIAENLNVDDAEVSQGFKAIADNIQAIMTMINSSDTSGPSSSSSSSSGPRPAPLASSEEEKDKLYNLFKTTQDKNLFYRQIPNQSQTTIQQNIRAADSGDVNAINIIKNELFKNKDKVILHLKGTSGGRRKRRTMKRRSKKSRKLMDRKLMKGGYVYGHSKKLDKESSIISASTSSKKKYPFKKRYSRKHR